MYFDNDVFILSIQHSYLSMLSAIQMIVITCNAFSFLNTNSHR